MEKLELTEEVKNYLEANKPLMVGNWSASCWGKRFKVNNNGIKLFAKEDEGLEKVIFDTEKKTISVKVKTQTTPANVPRTVDLSDATEFFEEVRKNIENILTEKGDFEKVTPNADRTVFEIS